MQLVGTHHIALGTPNFARLREFYTQTLGLPIVGGFPNRNIIFINIGTITIELIERTEGEWAEQKQGWVHLAFEVADTQATYAELAEKGIEFHILPKDFPDEAPSVRIAFFKDPDGNELELVQRLSPGYPQP